ncbi:hypothetical protein L211DRAFT_841056 [Terfezia boudieri ATCC MYA-4762]|uniref:Uncharacterized protein n=1 Tax=Terfezia boudieri ATCC MYA-4762 TaxID=1051890 RepID=A0A3N4LH83_9PEZI|nr:hypothetical protein L211DRAFT_841056 [Terfezia boudieri ATCC MYA-4762]
MACLSIVCQKFGIQLSLPVHSSDNFRSGPLCLPTLVPLLAIFLTSVCFCLSASNYARRHPTLAPALSSCPPDVWKRKRKVCWC